MSILPDSDLNQEPSQETHQQPIKDNSSDSVESPCGLSSHLQSRIWQLAWPVMLSNITVPLLGLVDTAVLGHLDDSCYLGAVALGNQLLVLMLWSFGFLRMGTTALTAFAVGAQHSQFNVFNQGLVVALLIALPLMVSGQLAGPWIIQWMGASAEISHAAQEYLAIRLYAAPAVLIQYVIIGWFIGRSDARTPLFLLVLANSVNALLDVLLVYQFGMTSDGVAWASFCADYLSAFVGLWLVQRALNKSNNKPSLLKDVRWPGWGKLKPVMTVNRDLFIRTLCLLGVLTFFTSQGAQQGDDILALNAIMLTLLLFISNALDGFAHAAEALIAQSRGAENNGQLKQVIVLTGLNSAIIALGLSLLLLLLGQSLIGRLTDLVVVLQLLDEYRWWLICLPIIGFSSYWLDGVFIGFHAMASMRNAMLASALLVFLPVWFLTQTFTNHGLWFSFYAFLLARSLFLIPSFLTILNKHQIFAEKN